MLKMRCLETVSFETRSLGRGETVSRIFIIKKGKTKKGSIKLIIEKDDDKYNFIVIKTHKENYALAEKLKVGSFVSAVGINKFRAIICTQLKQLPKMDESRQTILPFT